MVAAEIAFRGCLPRVRGARDGESSGNRIVKFANRLVLILGMVISGMGVDAFEIGRGSVGPANPHL